MPMYREPVESDSDAEFRQTVLEFLSTEMDERQATVVALRHVWGLSVLETINHTGLSEAEVKQLTLNGMKALLKQFPPELPTI